MISFFGKRGRILRNLYVPYGSGGTREIDLLFITAKGIFVIESKNYKGYIFGSEDRQEWTVTLYAGKSFTGRKRTNKYHFFNPVWQNDAHIKALRRYLGMNIPMFSLIVFSNECELKHVECTATNTVICRKAYISQAVSEAWDNCPDVLSEKQIDYICNRLDPLTDTDGSEKYAHINELQTRYSSTEVCPWCGGKLVIRTAKQGRNAGNQFYGCSNYPKCKYTKDV